MNPAIIRLIPCLAKLLPSVLLAVFLASCGSIPIYTSANSRLETERSMFQDHEVPSGAIVASGRIPWWVLPDCRNNFNEDDWKNSGGRKLDNLKVDKFWTAYCLEAGYPVSEDKDFIGLALSGGGMRAAVFSAAVMFELEDAGILQEVDVISSVSGGSMTAALYGLSCSDLKYCPATVEGPDRLLWLPDSDGNRDPKLSIFDRLDINLEWRFVFNSLWPDRQLRYWFTNYDRSDIMAETLADNLYDNSLTGGEGYRFQDLNLQRPTLIINATNFTRIDPSGNGDNLEYNPEKPLDRLNFQFTKESFEGIEKDEEEKEEGLCSKIDQYPLANAVMASSAFPGIFHYVTLSNYCPEKNGGDITYLHLFDGGNSDNLGLIAFERLFSEKNEKNLLSPGKKLPTRVIIFEVDATLGLTGKSPRRADPRNWYDYFVDSNILETSESLMNLGYNRIESNIDRVIKIRICKNGDKIGSGVCFARIKIALTDLDSTKIPGGLELWGKVKKIKTRLRTDRTEITHLKNAARLLVRYQFEKHCNDEAPAGNDTIALCPPSKD